MSPTSSGATSTAFFDAIARRYDRVYAPVAERSRERMARVVAAMAPGARVLDLGVGTGRELPALLDAGLEVVGLDGSAEMLAVCARRARPIELVHADFYDTRLPFGDEAFDAVLALHGTLLHPPRADALRGLVAEVRRVLRPGGLLYLESPSRAWLERLPEVVEIDGRRITRTLPDRLFYEDLVVGESIEGRVPSEPEWRALLEPAFAVRCDPLGADEIVVVARDQRPST